jgi:hypothetical protein
MATLKEFEDALRQHGMVNALAILDEMKKRDRERRSVAPARRVVGRKMTAELARTVLEMHSTTGMTQQEIAFKLGVNQGRVNEVIKRGKWLSGDPAAPEAMSRDKAMQRLTQRAQARRTAAPATPALPATAAAPKPPKPTPAPTPKPSSPAPVAPRPPELPLGRAPVAAKSAPPAARAPQRRPSEDVTPIVSAQLAFLDL